MDPKSNGMKDGSGDQPGEGNYDAARRYQKGLDESVQKGDADELAEKARKALENPEEGEELRDAEERAKQGDTGHGAHKNVPK